VGLVASAIGQRLQLLSDLLITFMQLLLVIFWTLAKSET
jgi:hypothetical protein